MIEVRQHDSSYNVVMTSCPFCGQEFDEYGRDRVDHLTNCPDTPEAATTGEAARDGGNQ